MAVAVATRTLLEVRDLHVNLGQSHVLQGVSFDVPEGGVTALLGTKRRRQDDDAARDPRPRRRRGRVRLGGDDLTSLRRTGSCGAASATSPRTATSSPG